jgi:hypothetical protein
LNDRAAEGDREAQRRARLAHSERLLHDRKYRQQWEQQKHLASAPRATGSEKCIADQRFFQRVPGYALRVRSFALD